MIKTILKKIFNLAGFQVIKTRTYEQFINSTKPQEISTNQDCQEILTIKENCTLPPKFIPAELASQYTMQGQVPITFWYFDNRFSETKNWSNQFVENYIEKYSIRNIYAGETNRSVYYNGDIYCAMACSKYLENIKGKNIAVIGSLTPWIESIAINFGAASVTTVEYNKPDKTSYINTLSYEEFIQSGVEYDAIFSYSSIEHSGLGRYGDPLDPDGDIKAVNSIYNALKVGGCFFLAVPVGPDQLVWNAHRIYGKKRLPKLIERFEEIEWIGPDKSIMDDMEVFANQERYNGIQPLIVLKKLA